MKKTEQYKLFCKENPTNLTYKEWLEDYNKNEVYDSYQDGLCPDCYNDIPKNVSEGEACLVCEHVFTKAITGLDK